MAGTNSFNFDILDLYANIDEAGSDIENDEMSDENYYSEEDSEQEVSDQTTVEKGKRGRPKGYRKNKEDEVKRQKRDVLSLIPIALVGAFMCCVNVCTTALTTDIITRSRETFQNLRVIERGQYILDWIIGHTSFDTHTGKYSTAFLIGNVTVCKNAFLKVLGFPMSTYYAIRREYIDGCVKHVGPGKQAESKGGSTMFAIAWLTNFAERNADKMPDSVKLQLPSCLTKQSIYSMMIEDAHSQQQDCISLSHMLRIWRSELPHIKIPKKNRFTICDTCIKIKEGRAKSTNKETRALWDKKRSEHLTQQNLERRKYYKHILKARQNPNKYLSIIMDAMDQEKTSLPKLTATPKTLSNVWKVKVGLMAALVHGIGVYGFFDTYQWGHGSSYTISILVQVLLMMDQIPDTLYLQLDNCPGQNKNRFVLGFLAYLVEAGVFKKIKLSFLMVGHTHEDIDQVFSRLSVWLAREQIYTIDELIKCFESCSKKLNITGLLTTEVYDFGSWMNLNSLKNHSHPHVFKITADENGKSVIHYKKWTTDKKWLNCSGSELYLIRDDASTKGKLPIIQANTDRLDIERMSKDIDMVARFYKKPEIASWWNRFFEDIITEEETDTTERDVMNDLRANRWRETDTRETDPLEMDLPQIDEPIPPVIIGKKQPNTTRGPLQEGDLVLLDSLRFTEQWPQLGKVIHTEEEEVIVQWFWGSKTSTWTPATKPVKGERNRREPFLLTFKKEVIWLSGFNLTPSGMLPKAIRDKVDSYFD